MQARGVYLYRFILSKRNIKIEIEIGLYSQVCILKREQHESCKFLAFNTS